LSRVFEKKSPNLTLERLRIDNERRKGRVDGNKDELREREKLLLLFFWESERRMRNVYENVSRTLVNRMSLKREPT
jgi:hypothetical protein